MIREYLLQIILIAAGLLLFLRTMSSLAKKHLTETVSMFWGSFSILLVLGGLVLIPFEWDQYMSLAALVIFAVLFFLLLAGMFYLSQLLSYNMRKIQELAIQISLLNQEHIKVDYYLSALSGEPRNKIWRTDTISELIAEENTESAATCQTAAEVL